MTVIEKLYRLQRIDKALKEVEIQQQDQTQLKHLVQLKKREQNLEIKTGQLEWRLRGLKHQLSQGELDVADLVDKIDKYSEVLYNGSIQSSKELEHLESNIENLRSQQSEIEQTLLELMEEVEIIENELVELKDTNETLKCQCAELEVELKENLARLRSEERRHRGRREALVSDIPEEFYKLYLKIYNRYSGLAVVRIRGKICSGCQVSLPTMMIDKVKNSTEPVYCEFCGRILYYK